MGIYYYNSETGQYLKPLSYKKGIPLCHDPLYDAEVLGNMCHDELDHDTDDNYRPDNDNEDNEC